MSERVVAISMDARLAKPAISTISSARRTIVTASMKPCWPLRPVRASLHCGEVRLGWIKGSTSVREDVPGKEARDQRAVDVAPPERLIAVEPQLERVEPGPARRLG